jgi:hypothetical protein
MFFAIIVPTSSAALPHPAPACFPEDGSAHFTRDRVNFSSTGIMLYMISLEKEHFNLVSARPDGA